MSRKLVRGASNVTWVVVALACLGLLGLVLFPMFSSGYPQTTKQFDMMNLKKLGIANLMYMSDHDGYGPPPDQWMDILIPYTKNEGIYRSPQADSKDEEYGYAYLRELGGVRLDDVLNPEEVPVVINSSDLRTNVAGGLELLPSPPRYADGNNIAFLNSHVKTYKTAPEFVIELTKEGTVDD